jgi:hypothetical protein
MKIVIDGNIGSGKTTQLNLLEQKGWTVQREPIEEWPLDLFYTDKPRWALLLQLKILQTLRPLDKTAVYERCLLSSRYVFWELLRESVHPAEDDVYQSQYEKDVWYPDVYIFLAKDPKLAYDHIQQRQQAGDSGITLKYLKQLDVLYKKLIMNMPCKVHVINAHQSPEQIHAQILSLLRVDGSVHVPHLGGEKVQTARPHRWKMLCPSFSSMRHMS